MPGHFKKLVLLLSFLLFCLSEEASARIALTGLADLEYTEFQEKNQSAEVEVSQFKQRYVVGYSTGGTIIDRGVGDYALSLGYQYLKADTTFDSGDLGSGETSASGHTFLWNGSINIAPKKIPFKLNIYSGDTNVLVASEVGIPGVKSGLAPGAINKIEGSGLSRTSGLNLHLEFGGKGRRGNGGNGNGNGGNGNGGNGNGGNGNGGNGNGNGGNGNGGNGNGNGGNGNGGNGNGNGFIRLSLPKVRIDYAKTITDSKDVYESTDDLRFSLNDKRNWFHYNWKRYDNLLGRGDQVQEGFLIGNVNRNGGREWFYLNNWLILSTDAGFRRADEEDVPGTSDTYSVNMFASAFRSRWDATFYGTYTQMLDSEGYSGTSQISLPLYLSIIPSRDSSLNWKSSFTQNRAWNMDDPATSADEEKTTMDGAEVVEDISFSQYHLTGQDLTFRSKYSLSKAMVGVGEGSNTSQALAFSVGSGPARSYSYGMSYTVNVVKDDDPGDDASDSKSQVLFLNGRYAYAITQRIGVTATQTATFSEDKDSAYPETRNYITTVGANLYIHRTLSIDLSGGRSYSENIGASHSESIGSSGNIRFTPASWLKATSSNSYSESKREDLIQMKITESSSYSTNNNMEIKVNRSFSSRTNIKYNVEDERSAMRKSSRLEIDEGFEYVRSIQRYKARTLYSINGSVNYTESKATSGQVSSETSSQRATLGLNHYPYRRLSWGASGSYGLSRNAAPSQGGSVYVAIPFPKLNISANYSFSRSGSGGEEEIDAQRFLVKVSKTF